MRIEFNTMEHRKVMVEALSELMGIEAMYMKVPTCAYKIDCFTVTKDGALEFEEPLTEEQLGKLLEFLASRGFTAKDMLAESKEPEDAADATEEPAENTENATESAENAENVENITESAKATEEAVEALGEGMPSETAEGNADTTETATEASEGTVKDLEDDEPTPENTGLTIALPIDKVNIENLQRLLDGKGSLLKKALGIEALPIEVSEDKVSFPWFTSIPSLDEIKAYTELISAICRKSKERSRITVKDHPVENEKYAFRCFLLGLGFIGKNYKEERKILLRNLSGNSAFKTEKEAADEISE